jgi:Ser/Thr protein kinase RdoA (MazF antagonist)
MSKEDFYELTPDQVLNALENEGFEPTGEFTQLNSYENRVFDIRLEENKRVIAKFYRPGRWNSQTILEEHEFLNDLNQAGLPAVAPIDLEEGRTLGESQGIYFALWPKAYGRMVDELTQPDLEKLGRTLARFHNVGEQKKFKHRPVLNSENYGWINLELLDDWVAPEVRHRYFDAAEAILEFLDDEMNPQQFIRVHGDCHRGNILRADTAQDPAQAFFFVDFDDCCTSSPVQDFWMLLSSDESKDEGQAELESLVKGYEEFRHFDAQSLELLPALRGLRLLHYAAWIAKRWEDPSFPRIFPQFRDYNYWASETEALEGLANRISK